MQAIIGGTPPPQVYQVSSVSFPPMHSSACKACWELKVLAYRECMKKCININPKLFTSFSLKRQKLVPTCVRHLVYRPSSLLQLSGLSLSIFYFNLIDFYQGKIILNFKLSFRL